MEKENSLYYIGRAPHFSSRPATLSWFDDPFSHHRASSITTKRSRWRISLSGFPSLRAHSSTMRERLVLVLGMDVTARLSGLFPSRLISLLVHDPISRLFYGSVLLLSFFSEFPHIRIHEGCGGFFIFGDEHRWPVWGGTALARLPELDFQSAVDMH